MGTVRRSAITASSPPGLPQRRSPRRFRWGGVHETVFCCGDVRGISGSGRKLPSGLFGRNVTSLGSSGNSSLVALSKQPEPPHLHGARPDAFVVCHEPSRKTMRGVSFALPSILPSIKQVIDLTVRCGSLTNPAIRPIGIAINTASMDRDSARDYLKRLEFRGRTNRGQHRGGISGYASNAASDGYQTSLGSKINSHLATVK